MKRQIEFFAKSTSTKNFDERIIVDSNKDKHLEYFMNGSWRHSSNCKKHVNNTCTRKK
ncbi:MAG: hypothetical protein ACPKQO_04590 [Nitrososphaeraceae archaeon]